MAKNRTTAPKPLPKPVKRRMYATLTASGKLPDITDSFGCLKCNSIARLSYWANGGYTNLRTIPVLVTVTPIRAKRAGGAGGEGKRGRGA